MIAHESAPYVQSATPRKDQLETRSRLVIRRTGYASDEESIYFWAEGTDRDLFEWRAYKIDGRGDWTTSSAADCPFVESALKWAGPLQVTLLIPDYSEPIPPPQPPRMHDISYRVRATASVGGSPTVVELGLQGNYPGFSFSELFAAPSCWRPVSPE